MKNLWIVLTKYNAFFWFLLFFSVSVYLVVKNNSFQRASAINSSNAIVGSVYSNVNSWTSYLSLGEANTMLAEENAQLRREIQLLSDTETTETNLVLDSENVVQYEYLVAKVINNSINQKNNYITINKGTLAGVRKGMGVISPKGVVGIVLNVSENFATIQSVLHSDSRISAALDSSNAFGSLVWGGNIDSRYAMLRDIPNHVIVHEGESVFTSGYSLFPPGVEIGKVAETGVSTGESFLDIRVALSTSFHNLQYVYVVKDTRAAEKEALEGEADDHG